MTFSRCFPEPSPTQLVSSGAVFWAICRARIHSLVSFFSSGLFFGPPVFRGFLLGNFQGCFDILSSFFVVVFFVFWGGGLGGGGFSFCFCFVFLPPPPPPPPSVFSKAFLSSVIPLISAIQRRGLIFLILLRAFSWVFFYRAFLSGSVLSTTPYVGLLCLLRMHVINTCVGDTWQRLWRDDFTHNGKQVVNRLKIPQGLSTLMFRRWSEVPSRGGVRGDSPLKKRRKKKEKTCFTKTWHFDCLFSVFIYFNFFHREFA